MYSKFRYDGKGAKHSKIGASEFKNAVNSIAIPTHCEVSSYESYTKFGNDSLGYSSGLETKHSVARCMASLRLGNGGWQPLSR